MVEGGGEEGVEEVEGGGSAAEWWWGGGGRPTCWEVGTELEEYDAECEHVEGEGVLAAPVWVHVHICADVRSVARMLLTRPPPCLANASSNDALRPMPIGAPIESRWTSLSVLSAFVTADEVAAAGAVVG